MNQHNQLNPGIGNKNGKKYIPIWILIIILSAFCLYLLFNQTKTTREAEIELQRKQRIVDSVVTNRRYLQADFDAASAKTDQLMSKNIALKDSLQADKAAISDMQAQIRTILTNQKATQADLMMARNLIYAFMY